MLNETLKVIAVTVNLCNPVDPTECIQETIIADRIIGCKFALVAAMMVVAQGSPNSWAKYEVQTRPKTLENGE